MLAWPHKGKVYVKVFKKSKILADLLTINLLQIKIMKAQEFSIAVNI